MDKPELEEYLTSDLINKDYKPVAEKRTYEVFTKDQLKTRINYKQEKIYKLLEFIDKYDFHSLLDSTGSKGVNKAIRYYIEIIMKDDKEYYFEEILKESD